MRRSTVLGTLAHRKGAVLPRFATLARPGPFANGTKVPRRPASQWNAPNGREGTPGALRVVLVTDLFFPGVNGVITSVRNLAEELARSGHHVSVVCPGSKQARAWARKNGVELAAVTGWTVGMGIEQRIGVPSPRTRRDLRQLIRTANVVHLHTPFALGHLASSIARSERVPVVVTSHLKPENFLAAARLQGRRTGALSWLLWKWLAHSAALGDVVVSPSAHGAEEVRRMRPGMPVHVVSNGVAGIRTEIGCLQPISRGETIHALYVGRLQREKRVDELLHALRACRRTGLDVHLTVVGKGPEEWRLKALADRLGLADDVSFVGFVSNAHRDALYSRSHVFWMASRAELQCCSALEAMSAGCPIIAARAGALPETVREGEGGHLYTPGNVAEIAKVMHRLAHDSGGYQELQASAKAVAAEHSTERTTATMLAVYHDLVRQHAERSRRNSPANS